ncbi:transcription factor CP2-like isoform X2 [Babylonia areolata]
MAGMAHIISSINGTTNPFSFNRVASSPSMSSSAPRSGTTSERERRGSLKGGGSASAEHNVKGGKTSKRGKGMKLKVLSFSDIENGFSCFGQSASSWADTLGDISSDRLLTISDQQETNCAWEDAGGGAGKRTKISHPMTAWDIVGGLAADFDGSFSGLGTELGTSSYNMSEALLALPVFKQENLENGFQYILGAATSPAVKMNEETLTYLNQGQSYEIKVKKLGDLSEYQGKSLRSVLKVLFHERRLQFMEKEQVDLWRQARPGERILDVDVPLSYGVVEVKTDGTRINQAEFTWDPTKETGVYFRVQAISTEFTPRKHGGEKGVPFRIQLETYAHGDREERLLHAASCQVKVFKPKGADRKHKTDREKMEKRSDTEKEKYQPSYECTVLTEVPLDQVMETPSSFGQKGSSPSLASSFSELSCGPTAAGGGVSTPSITPPGTTPPGSTPSPSRQLPPSPHTPPSVQPQHPPLHSPRPQHSVASHGGPAGDSLCYPLSSEAPATEVQNWLVFHRFSNYTRVFQHFSGADLLRLNRDDLVQICGLADGIRLDNALQARCVRARLTIFICQEPESVYHALYLQRVCVGELQCKLAALFGIQACHIGDMFLQGPSGIHIMVSDEVLRNTQDQSRFYVEGVREETMDKYRILFKTVL